MESIRTSDALSLGYSNFIHYGSNEANQRVATWAVPSAFALAELYERNEPGGSVRLRRGGNLTYDALHHDTYDDEGRIVAVGGGGTAMYVYDADGLRIHKTGGEAPEDYVYNLGGHATGTFFRNGGYLRGTVYAGSLHVATYDNSTTYFDHTDWQGTERVRGGVNGRCAELPGSAQRCSGEQRRVYGLGSHLLRGKSLARISSLRIVMTRR